MCVCELCEYVCECEFVCVCVSVGVGHYTMNSSRVPSRSSHLAPRHTLPQVKEGSGTMLVTAVGEHSKKGMILKLLTARESKGRSPFRPKSPFRSIPTTNTGPGYLKPSSHV